MAVVRTWVGIGIVVLALSSTVQAMDWPQWRGPQRDGVAVASPPLATSWPEDGPPKLWESEKLPSGRDGGYGSPVVADGRVFLYVNERVRLPVVVRKLSARALRNLGWSADRLPPELQQAAEEARTSPERAELKGKALRAWIEDWLNARLSEQQRKRHGSFLRRRLAEGKDAIPLSVLETLATIQDREFASQEELDKWFEEHDIAGELKRKVAAQVPTEIEKARDVFVCLDAGDGKTLWKVGYPEARRASASSTVCVANGRVYGLGSKGEALCLDAKTGREIWRAKCGGGHSSFLCADGLVVVIADALIALNADAGQVVWTQRKVRSHENSPVLWRKAYLICNTSRGVACVSLKTGEVRWTVEGGGPSTAAVAEDHMAILTNKKETGLIAYRLSKEKAEKLWNIPDLTDRAASPIILDGHVYAVARRKVVCIELPTGVVQWEGVPGSGDICSPIVADGKLLAILRGGGAVAMMSASPGKYELLAKAKLRLSRCASPAFADGKLYVRMRDSIACFDLRRPSPAASLGR